MQSATQQRTGTELRPAQGARPSRVGAMLLTLALSGVAHTASADSLSSNLTEQGATALFGQQFVQLFNARDLNPVSNIDINSELDEARSTLSLRASIGLLTLNAHACSGPLPNSNAGSANASGVVNYAETFTITSTTLSPGTPVTVAVRIATASRGNGALTYPVPSQPPANDFASVSAHVGIRIDALQTTAASFAGDLSAGESGTQPPSEIRSGIMVNGSFMALVSGQVGRSFGISIQTTMSTGSRAGVGNESDANGQFALLWGGAVVGGDAQLLADDGFVFPSLDGVTAAHALANLPMPLDLPEPSGTALIATGLVALAGLSRRRVARHASAA